MIYYINRWEPLPKGVIPPDTAGMPKRENHTPDGLLSDNEAIVGQAMPEKGWEGAYPALSGTEDGWNRARRNFLNTLQRENELEFSEWSVFGTEPDREHQMIWATHEGVNPPTAAHRPGEADVLVRNPGRRADGIPGWSETTELQRWEILNAIAQWMRDIGYYGEEV